ncbi:dihydropteroate synthase [Oceaniglobus trochenteri]|uniref:dihydropteroate synthase n=1 Tax=Oceaniglobus trochenteri TaxID=2763260 RepID=UPI001CFF8955|nr:dihydropteroate synthase [Oceaniglobus trochenteri]
MTEYFRPLVQTGPRRPADAVPLAGGAHWFTMVERLQRGRPSRFVPAQELPADALDRLSRPRPPIAGLDMDQPRLMGILNVTPDSFSDGGLFAAPDAALAQARALAAQGADILDIGGESTRPGAATVPVRDEIERTAPVIAALRAGHDGPVSIDTRKAAVAEAALEAGATILNDVSAMSYDDAMARLAARTGAPICLMHAQGTPEVMQKAPRYDDVLLDVYDYLAGRVEMAVEAGISRDRIIIDPGIGFGKTLEHNLTLLAGLSLFHGLGCAVLLGASRKKFIGTLGGTDEARARAPGSVGVALAGVAQGVQILRVHDIAETRQALTLWWAAVQGAAQTAGQGGRP